MRGRVGVKVRGRVGVKVRVRVGVRVGVRVRDRVRVRVRVRVRHVVERGAPTLIVGAAKDGALDHRVDLLVQARRGRALVTTDIISEADFKRP